MNTCRRVRGLAALVFMLAVSGCQMIQPTRPLTILARDAETQAPLPGVQICLHPMEGHLPAGDTANTGKDGVARMEVNGHDERAIGIEASVNGYMQATTFIPATTVNAIATSPRFSKDQPRQVAFVVDLYAGPRPTVELVIPAAYHGMIKADIAVEHDVACPAGQRLFRFPIGPDGTVHVTGPNLLERVDVADFRFRYADNAPLSNKARDTQLGYWWLRHEGNFDYFVVGDKGDYALARSNGEDGGNDTPQPRSSSGGGGGGGGRGGHHGGGRGGMGGGGMGGGGSGGSLSGQ